MHIFSTAHPACDHSKSVNSFLQSTHLTELNRERALGGSRRGVKRSWREALIMPPASRLTELLTRERVILQDRISLSLLPWETRITFLWEKPLVAFLHWAKTLLSTLEIISTRRTGRLASVLVDEEPPLDLEQGTPWTSDLGANGGASSRCTKKSSEIDLWDKTGSSAFQGGEKRKSCDNVKFYKSQSSWNKTFMNKSIIVMQRYNNWKF